MNNTNEQQNNRKQQKTNDKYSKTVRSVMNYSTITEPSTMKITKYNYGIDKYINQN
jgi:hypothetical protein